jgi:hypothetical protein
MHVRSTWLLTGLLVLSGCASPAAPPPATPDASPGTPAAAASAEPAAAASLATATTVEVTGQVIVPEGTRAAHLSLSLIRLGGSGIHTAATDAEGRFTVTLPAAEAQPTEDGPARFSLFIYGPGFATVSQTIAITTSHVALEPLRFVQATATTTETGDMRVSWDSPPNQPYSFLVHALTPDGSGTLGAILQWRGTGNTVVVPPYLLNDRTAYTFSVTVSDPPTGRLSNTPRQPYTSPDGATKRVRAIDVVRDDADKPCPWLHDGDLVASGETRPVTALEVDLGAVRPLSRLVVYGLAAPEGGVAVSLAATPGAWGAPVATLASDVAAQDIATGEAQARYIRLEAPPGAIAADWGIKELRAIGPE